MRIAEMTACIARLRLRKEFRHASFTRRWSDNFLVCCRLADGTVGWGEGVPRSYVTGETPEQAMSQWVATPMETQLDKDCENWQDVFALCDAYQPPVTEHDARGCQDNAHRCAVELSILDAYGKLFHVPLSDATRQFSPAASIRQSLNRVQYSGAVSSGTGRKEMLSAIAMRLYGFHHCKVKVGMHADLDQERLRRIRRCVGRRMDLRVDANEAWPADEVRRRVLQLLPYNISSVEQPVRHEEVGALADVRRELPVPIMLDESLTSLQDAQQAIRLGTCDLFNIRLSKCGGFLNSLRLAALAHAAGLGYQLGCHPGESGILSAAGRHFAVSVRDIRYREGSADRHLLKDSITVENMTFGLAGWASALDRPGLGVTINEAALEALVRTRQTHRLQ